MSANIARKAFEVALPKVTDLVARTAPDIANRAKKMVAASMGLPDSKVVNLGQIASARGGSNAQMVGEALVRSGLSTDKLFESMPVIRSEEFTAMRRHFEDIEAASRNESDALVRQIDKSPGPSVDDAIAIRADNVAISNAMKALAISNVQVLYAVKVALDHLSSDKVARYLIDQPNGAPRRGRD